MIRLLYKGNVGMFISDVMGSFSPDNKMKKVIEIKQKLYLLPGENLLPDSEELSNSIEDAQEGILYRLIEKGIVDILGEEKSVSKYNKPIITKDDIAESAETGSSLDIGTESDSEVEALKSELAELKGQIQARKKQDEMASLKNEIAELKQLLTKDKPQITTIPQPAKKRGRKPKTDQSTLFK